MLSRGPLIGRPILTSQEEAPEPGSLLAVERPCEVPDHWPTFQRCVTEPGAETRKIGELGRAEPPDRRTEVAWIAHWIRSASQAGMSGSHIAVAVPDLALYAPLIEELLPDYRLLPGPSLLHTPTARLLLALLALPTVGYPLPELRKLSPELATLGSPDWAHPERWRAVLERLAAQAGDAEADDLAGQLQRELAPSSSRIIAALLGGDPLDVLEALRWNAGLAQLPELSRRPGPARDRVDAARQVMALFDRYGELDPQVLRAALGAAPTAPGPPRPTAVRVLHHDQLADLAGTQLLFIAGLTEGVARPLLDGIAGQRILLSGPSGEGDRELQPPSWLTRMRLRRWPEPATRSERGPRLGAYAAAMRRRIDPTSYDGDLRGVVHLLGKPVLSATRLEEYARCPFRYLAQSVLRLDRPGGLSPEVSPLDLGLLTHRLLFELSSFLRSQSDRPLASVPEDQRQAVADSASELIETLLAASFSGLAAYPPVFRERARRRLGGVLHGFLQAELSELSRLSPAYFELGFGQTSGMGDLASADPVEVPGTGVQVAGSIDRVELARLGGLLYVMVYDYKTGARPSTTAILGGIGFQLPLYLMVVEPLLRQQGETFDALVPLGGRFYQVADPEGLGRRGGIYDREGLEAQGLSTRREAGSLSGDELDRLIDRYREELVELSGRITAGAFATGTLTPRWMGCAGCAYSSACRVDPLRNARRAQRGEHA